MQLSRAQKDTLLQSANHVYFSFLALDFFKNKAFSINSDDSTCSVVDEPETLLSFLERNRVQWEGVQAEKAISISIAGSRYLLNISLAPGTRNRYLITLNNPTATLPTNKVPNDYTDVEAARVLANKTFSIDNISNQDKAVSLALNREYVIGGTKKIDLYRTHLVTLSNIINKIQQENDISSLLVALATGSGKTYVQALLFALLAMAGFNAVFALPDKLITQLKKDWRRILPDAMIDRIVTLRDHEDRSTSGEQDTGVTNVSGPSDDCV